MRVACIKNGVVINTIVVTDLNNIPDIVAIDENGNPITKDQVEIVQTEIGSKDDLYIEGKGFFRYAGK